jgi:[ribosomal protein S5]-alanine N-acetyltransferase
VSGRGGGREATRLVLAYAFGTLQLHRVEVRVLDFNTRAIRMYERCGFSREGVEREGALIGRRWENDVRLSILAHEFSAGGRG